ncbi:hypothetical protein GF338_08930 [candidate division WOR-3 bacterium]|nr:hypothetical protein [candidate division WOR-3 bacterium]
MGSSAKKLLLVALGLFVIFSSAYADEWFEKISFKGDLRHRFEWYGKESWTTDSVGNDVLEDTLHSRYRNRVRARLSLKAKPEDNLEIGMRLVTGGGDPVSTNQTFDGAFGTKGFQLDRAYFKWSPFGGLYLKGGKYGTPWELASKAFWDGDLAVEGATVGWDGDFGSVSPFVNFNYLWVDEIKKDPADVMLYLGQGGANFAFGGAKLLVAVNYFTYTNIVDHSPLYDEDFFGNTEGTTDVEEIVIDTVIDGADTTINIDTTITQEPSGGYAYGYDVLQPSFKLGLKLGDFPISLYGDLVYNINSEVSEDNMGYMFGIKLGKAKKPGSFEVSANYGALQADCSNATFVDSDFAGGGTGGNGLKVGGAVAITKKLTGGVTFFANTLGPDSDTPKKYYRFQGDLKMKF